jgi:hypothetical protein
MTDKPKLKASKEQIAMWKKTKAFYEARIESIDSLLGQVGKQ